MALSLFPDICCKNAFTVDYEALLKKGITTLLFDIDNTLVGHGEPMDERALKLIGSLKDMGFTILCVSNNRESRVKSFCAPGKIDYVYKAGKPLFKGYRMAMEKAGAGISQTAFIGDQLFTDICGARALGIYCILVRPLYPKEEIQIVLKRFLEAPILALFRLIHPDRNLQ